MTRDAISRLAVRVVGDLEWSCMAIDLGKAAAALTHVEATLEFFQTSAKQRRSVNQILPACWLNPPKD